MNGVDFMTLKFGTPRVSSRTRRDPDTRRDVTTYTICVTVENDDGSADVDTSVTLYYQDRDTTPGTPPGAIISTICTRSITVPRRRVIRDAGGNVVIEANGTIDVCCTLRGRPLDGQEFIAVGGTTKDSDGDVQSGGRGNFYSPTLTYTRPRRVSMRPGEKLPYSSLVGVGFDKVEALKVTAALEVPPGWDLDFPGPAPKGPYPAAFEFTVRARPGAAAGETMRLTLRTHLPSEGDAQCEETIMDFVVGDPDTCCPCCGASKDGGPPV
ncbi:hypothetical protein D1F64_15105 [Breoghania sp. L-A4]|nr:hypothetical protein D1F64_15105 [Breoghania sp. L-A4]